MTDYDPSSQAPKLNGLSWMTRNLGALSDDYDETGSAKGFVYQWGRKDPFPSGAGWNDLNDITVYDAKSRRCSSRPRCLPTSPRWPNSCSTTRCM